ncbi:MAG TPA: F0F1 ATP synthase subunit B [Bacteroidota bacterium]|jgi:F-type H+-transporting ATPase subunit b|nr:F0F1 ATP synthase subunit B [Bacteroidota bacterium]
MFEINPGLIIWTCVTFILLVIVLGKYAWKPMMGMISKREDQIRDALTQAEKARAEAAEMMRKNEQNIARAEAEYQKIIREGKALAEKLKDEIVAKAQQQAEQELARAEEEIQRNIEAAKQQLRTEVADLAIRAAEKILEENLDAQKQKKLIDSVIDKLPKN